MIHIWHSRAGGEGLCLCQALQKEIGVDPEPHDSQGDPDTSPEVPWSLCLVSDCSGQYCLFPLPGLAPSPDLTLATCTLSVGQQGGPAA